MIAEQDPLLSSLLSNPPASVAFISSGVCFKNKHTGGWLDISRFERTLRMDSLPNLKVPRSESPGTETLQDLFAGQRDRI